MIAQKTLKRKTNPALLAVAKSLFSDMNDVELAAFIAWAINRHPERSTEERKRTAANIRATDPEQFTNSERLFAAWVGLPDEADTLKAAKLLRALNHRELSRLSRTKRAIVRYLKGKETNGAADPLLSAEEHQIVDGLRSLRGTPLYNLAVRPMKTILEIGAMKLAEYTARMEGKCQK